MLNILIVWFCTGLWHGASLNFILWGLYFAVFLVLEKTFLLGILKKIPRVFGHIYLIIVAMFGWALFYFTDLSKLGGCLGAMFGAGGLPATDILTESSLKGSIWLILAALILCAPVYPQVKKAEDLAARKSSLLFGLIGTAKVILLIAVFAVSSVSLVGSTYNPFLYFRF